MVESMHVYGSSGKNRVSRHSIDSFYLPTRVGKCHIGKIGRERLH